MSKRSRIRQREGWVTFDCVLDSGEPAWTLLEDFGDSYPQAVAIALAQWYRDSTGIAAVLVPEGADEGRCQRCGGAVAPGEPHACPEARAAYQEYVRKVCTAAPEARGAHLECDFLCGTCERTVCTGARALRAERMADPDSPPNLYAFAAGAIAAARGEDAGGCPYQGGTEPELQTAWLRGMAEYRRGDGDVDAEKDRTAKGAKGREGRTA
jgi:hypothetical protein